MTFEWVTRGCQLIVTQLYRAAVRERSDCNDVSAVHRLRQGVFTLPEKVPQQLVSLPTSPRCAQLPCGHPISSLHSALCIALFARLTWFST